MNEELEDDPFEMKTIENNNDNQHGNVGSAFNFEGSFY